MYTILRLTTAALLLLSFAACSAHSHAPQTVLQACVRVSIEEPPVWTASAAWTPNEDRVVLVGPDSHTLLVYTLRGELERKVELDHMAELDYSSPMRLQATDDGYVLGDEDHILWLDADFELRRLWKPFEHLASTGVDTGTLNDFAVLGRDVYAFADFLKTVPGCEEPDCEETITWHRGFVRIRLDEPEIVSLLELELGDKELDSYYFYSQRPYVAEMGKDAFVLRYSDPPRVFKAARRGLKPFHAAPPRDEYQTVSLLAHGGRLYLQAWRYAEAEAPEDETQTAPKLLTNDDFARLQKAERAVDRPQERFLFEIDPKSGRRLASYRLPTAASRAKLLPGRHFWAMIEQTSPVNLSAEDRTYLMLMPSSWLESRRSADGSEVVLQCPAS